jgi:hypothetical protein
MDAKYGFFFQLFHDSLLSGTNGVFMIRKCYSMLSRHEGGEEMGSGHNSGSTWGLGYVLE